MYKIIDYYTGNVLFTGFKTRKEAEDFKLEYGIKMEKDKVEVWNRLMLVERV